MPIRLGLYLLSGFIIRINFGKYKVIRVKLLVAIYLRGILFLFPESA